MTRTTRVPRVDVMVGGSALADVQSITVNAAVNLPDQLDVALRGAAPSALRAGAAVQVEVDGQRGALFRGEVVAVEHVFGADGVRITRLRAYDGLHRLRLRHDVATYAEVSIGSLAERWAGEAGLAAKIEADGPDLRTVSQLGESALDVLRELSNRCGVLFHTRDDVVHLFGRNGVGDPLQLRWGETLREARLELNSAAGPRPVHVAGWDPLFADTMRADESDSDAGAAPGPDETGVAGPVPLAGVVVSSEAEASALADAELGRRASAAKTLWAIADGDSRLRPGAIVEVGGDERLDGRYLLTHVSHRVDDRSGFFTELSTRLPRVGRDAGRGCDVQLATVADVDDPDALGRVAVTFDALADSSSLWLQVVVPGAGAGKGITMLPNVGDRVAVLAPSRQVGRAVVLGGLFGAAGAPDPGVVEGAVRRASWRTAGGRVVQLDDHASSVRVEDGNGSHIEMSPERVIVHSAVDLQLDAPGRTVTITAASVDFVQE
jgi:phage protein D/phage baseplate assembly protein gpV